MGDKGSESDSGELERVTPPPGGPWLEMGHSGTGYLSYYYSDPLARYPVRELTRPGDNKSDPNIETGTYGLFSTCEPGMRNRIVNDGVGTLFFVTSHRGRPRALAGYYELGWYSLGQRGASSKDWALAARRIRFVTPIPLADLAGDVPEAGEPRFRTQRRVSAESVTKLRSAVDKAPDQTPAYLAELRRIERFAISKSGYAYPSWGRSEGFSEDEASNFLSKSLGQTPNSAKGNQWLCSDCRTIVTNGALLRACPICQTVGSLSPLEQP